MDDAILQAMVMLFVVARVQHGWKQADCCAQLTTWPDTANSKIPRASDLPKEWDGEIQQLVRDKKMIPKIRDSVNSYNSFASIYCEDGLWKRESRKNSAFAAFYEVTEQSVVQWALNRKKDDDDGDTCSHLAVLLLKHLLVHDDHLGGKERVALANAMYDAKIGLGRCDQILQSQRLCGGTPSRLRS